MRPLSRLLALAGLCAPLLAGPALHAQAPTAEGREPSAALKADAKRRFNLGIELFREGDFSAALVEFLRAYEEVPNYRVLYNLGQVEFQRQNYPSALRYFERFLSEGGAELPRARRLEVEREVEKLKRRVARVRIETSPAGADVAIDDAPVGRTPLAEAIVISAGRRKITASLEGRPTLTRSVDVAGGDDVRVELAFPEPPPPPAEVPRAPLPSAPSGAPRAPFPWVAWGVTGALAAGAVASGVLALGAASDFDDRKDRAPNRRDDLEDAHAKLQRFTIATDVLIGLSAASAGFATYLTLTRDAAPATAAARVPASSLSLRLAVTPTGGAFAGEF